jgi:hypothetical protein
LLHYTVAILNIPGIASWLPVDTFLFIGFEGVVVGINKVGRLGPPTFLKIGPLL